MLRVRVGRKQPEARKLAEAIEAPLAWANTRELRRPSLIDHGLAEYVEDEPPPPITVPAAVWQGLEAVKDSGATNMLDRPAVIKIAEFLGFHETARWIEGHHGQYAEGLFKGFTVDTEEGKR